ncbi:alpha/beta hydrolase fold-domain-containing protein [Aspergillus stella-maris]|uniref:alpha/beta hydrolase fold-domain-containing protein n=1 Tax=Aspergillus stella-maris TaxID=1810926 RepID=UPI003CCDD706
MRDGYIHELRIVHPPSASPKLSDQDNKNENTKTPLILLIHGGGFIVGTNKQLIQFARLFAAIYGLTIALPSYRLAPENKLPVGTEDVWDTLLYIQSHASTGPINADLSLGFIVAGVSAGANIASNTVHRAVREFPGLVTGQWSSVPGFIVDSSILPEKYRGLWISRTQNADAPILSTKDMAWIEEMLGARHTVDYCPFVDMDSFKGIPKSYIQVCGMDPLRDDGIIYEKVLREYGVQTRFDAYMGVPHGVWAVFPKLRSSQRAVLDAVRQTGWLLGKGLDEARLKWAAGEMGIAVDAS